jgi:hypothetical protein
MMYVKHVLKPTVVTNSHLIVKIDYQVVYEVISRLCQLLVTRLNIHNY